jgi:SAM-dependent methyltransferase
MSPKFEIFYLLGFAPWDQEEVPEAVRSLVEGPQRLSPGRAIDVGCGRGNKAIYLAQNGWNVTGVDAVERALRTARRRASARSVSVDFQRGDVTRLHSAAAGRGFDLVLDCGCFHDMSEEERDRYPSSLARVAAPSAILQMFAFLPQALGRYGPRGASKDEVSRRFAPEWDVLSAEQDDLIAARGGWRGTGFWYRLARARRVEVLRATEPRAHENAR